MLIFLLIGVIVWLIIELLYRQTSYYKATHKSFASVRFDKGRYGEYLTYKLLKSQEKMGSKFLFNVYLNKEDGDTTEIDVLLIDKDGLFVFESKNYSGWIFGNEHQKMWTQCLPQGKNSAAHKEHFLNPIFQNKLHVSTLKKVLNREYPIYSVITFSERCTLKNIEISDPMVRVINRYQVASAVRSLSNNSRKQLTQQEIDSIYSALYPFTQVSSEVKRKHIEKINEKKSDKSETTVVEKKEASIDAIKVPLVCPNCGGKLILRTATSGVRKGKQFYGCSNYPKCHYIMNV